MNVLVLALALLRAFSYEDYDAVTRADVVSMGQPSVAAYATTEWASDGSRPVRITVNVVLDHPAAIAAVLAHEGREIRTGSQPDCGAYEDAAYAEQLAFFRWMDGTFGPPVLYGSNYMTRAALEQHLLISLPCEGERT